MNRRWESKGEGSKLQENRRLEDRRPDGARKVLVSPTPTPFFCR